MKNPELFNKTVDILVKSYHEGTLAHHEGAGCVLGNIIAHNLGVKVIPNEEAGYPYFTSNGGIAKQPKFKWSNGVLPYWASVQSMGVIHKVDLQNADLKAIGLYIKGKQQLASTGYSSEELLQIERAFESQYAQDLRGDQDGYKGLMAVVEALQIIHEANEVQTADAKEKFGVSRMEQLKQKWGIKATEMNAEGEAFHREIERGFRRDTLNVILGRPNVGKTSMRSLIDGLEGLSAIDFAGLYGQHRPMPLPSLGINLNFNTIVDNFLVEDVTS